MAFSYGKDAPVNYGAVDIYAVVVVPLHELEAPLVEVTEPPVLNLGVGNCVYVQLRSSLAIRTQVKHKQVQIVVSSPKGQSDTKCFQPGNLTV